MNTQFDTINTIYEDKTITNKTAAYIEACDQFESQASQFANNMNMVARYSVEELSKAYSQARVADCELAVYTACFAAERWLEKAWNNAD